MVYLGVEMADIQANGKIEVGDIVVTSTYLLGNFGRTIYIVFDENEKLKNVVFED